MKALLLLAPGVEEMEAVIVIDCLRRAEIEVVVAGLNELEALASRGVRLIADVRLDEVDAASCDCLILPGGLGGTLLLREDQRVLNLVRQFASDENKRVAFICAAALVVEAAGVLDGRAFTCHPTVREQLRAGCFCNDRVVIDGNLTSSQGPGTAFEFALALVTQALGEKKAGEIASPLILPRLC